MHNDSKPSLRIAVSAAGKVLVKCRAGCETPKVMRAMGLTMKDLTEMDPSDAPALVPVTSRDVPVSIEQVAALAVRLDAWQDLLLHQDTGIPGREYLLDRFGIDGPTAKRLGLGFAYDLPASPRVVVPFRDQDGVARGYQARSLQKDAAVRWLGPENPEGSESSWAKLGWFPGGSGWDDILICEGPGDALTGCALGFDTIGIRGASLASNPFVLEQVIAWVGDREAVVAGDGDPAGRRFAELITEALLDAGKRVRVLNLPDDEDLTSWREKDTTQFSRNIMRAIMEAEQVKSRTAGLLAWDEQRYSLTDLGGARYLRDYVASIGSGVKYTEEAGFFLLQDGVWRKDDRQAIRTHAQSVADKVAALAQQAMEMAGDGATQEDKKRAGRLMRYAKHAQTSKGLDYMLRELQAVHGVPVSLNDFDTHTDLLACLNGVVDLRTGELQPHNPALLLTRRVNLNYDPNAVCPRWEQFLEEVFPKHPSLPDYMRRLVGYGITGRTDEQMFAVHWGTGSNGKSIFTDTLTQVFQEFTVTTPFSTFEQRPAGAIPNDIAAMKGARLVMAAEGEANKPMAEAMLKRLTGRDMITARFMRREFFEFRPNFLLMLATNNKPRFIGQDEGLWRRVKLIPWERYFAVHERDFYLGEKLLRESQGILAWAIRGAQEWFAHGLKDPNEVIAATQEYRETSDDLVGFLPGVYVVDPNSSARVKDVFEAFQQYADEGNFQDLKRWSRRRLSAALEERGHPVKKSNGWSRYQGIRKAKVTELLPDHAEPEEGRSSEGPVALFKTDAPLKGADLNDYL